MGGTRARNPATLSAVFVFLVRLVFIRIVIYFFVTLVRCYYVVEDIAPHLQELTVLTVKSTWGRREISREGWNMEEKAPQHYNDMKTINASKLNKTDKNVKTRMTGRLG